MLFRILILQFVIQIISAFVYLYPQLIEIGNTIGIQCPINNYKNMNIYKNNLLKHGNSKYVYKKNTKTNTFLTKIKNITIDDLNSTYSCEYNANKTYTININESNFSYIPTKKDIYVKYVNNIMILTFKKVFPIPTCYINNTEFNKTHTEKLNKFYYTITQGFGIDYMKYCMKHLMIFCTLPNKNFEIKNKINCSRIHELSESKDMMNMGISAGMLVPLISLICYIIKRTCFGEKHEFVEIKVVN